MSERRSGSLLVLCFVVVLTGSVGTHVTKWTIGAIKKKKKKKKKGCPPFFFFLLRTNNTSGYRADGTFLEEKF